MAKLGISVRIDVQKIDKARLFKGEKGTYLDLTTFIDTDQQDQYGNNGFIAQSVSKEEREQGVQTAILGNTKVFYGAVQQAPVAPSHAGQPVVGGGIDPDIEIPFNCHMKNTIA